MWEFLRAWDGDAYANNGARGLTEVRAAADGRTGGSSGAAIARPLALLGSGPVRSSISTPFCASLAFLLPTTHPAMRPIRIRSAATSCSSARGRPPSTG